MCSKIRYWQNEFRNQALVKWIQKSDIYGKMRSENRCITISGIEFRNQVLAKWVQKSGVGEMSSEIRHWSGEMRWESRHLSGETSWESNSSWSIRQWRRWEMKFRNRAERSVICMQIMRVRVAPLQLKPGQPWGFLFEVRASRPVPSVKFLRVSTPCTVSSLSVCRRE